MPFRPTLHPGAGQRSNVPADAGGTLLGRSKGPLSGWRAWRALPAPRPDLTQKAAKSSIAEFGVRLARIWSQSLGFGVRSSERVSVADF